ncbi:MAG: hypothetical protein R2794_08675 [Chitinophagales bacterium]
MENKTVKTKVTAALATATVLAAIVFSAFYFNQNLALKDSLSEEKINAEKLLSEKLALDKEMNLLREDIAAMTGKNADMDKQLAALSGTLDKKQAELNKAYVDKNALKKMQSELESAKKLKADMDMQLASLQDKLQAANAELLAVNGDNKRLRDQVDKLNVKNKDLADNIQVLQALVADDYLAVATKGKKEKQTIKAKRTDDIMCSFSVPEEMADQISFRIVAPTGKKIGDERISTNIVQQENLTASIDPSGVKLNKRVEMHFRPEEKLEGGIYKIEVYNKDMYVGSCQVQLK